MTFFDEISTPTLALLSDVNSSIEFELEEIAWVTPYHLPGCMVGPYPDTDMSKLLEKIMSQEVSQILFIATINSAYLQKLAASTTAPRLQNGIKNGIDSLFWLMALQAHLANQMQNLSTWPAVEILLQTGNLVMKGYVINPSKNITFEVVNPLKKSAFKA